MKLFTFHKLFVEVSFFIVVSFLVVHTFALNEANDIEDPFEVDLFNSTITTPSSILLSEEAEVVVPQQNSSQPLPQKDSQFEGGESDVGNDRETSSPGGDLIQANIQVLEFPGESLKAFGRRTNQSDVFGEEVLVAEFRGFPFAEPPVKNLRFQRPVLKVPSNGFRALRQPPPCPQMSLAGAVIGDEDCLYMNIFVPVDKDDDMVGNKGTKMPVLVWFHGENPQKYSARKFSILSSGSMEDLQPIVFLQNRIIVVMPQYRLGTLGFLSVANDDLNGNMGAADQLLALEWVQRFIPNFGGDISQVTVMGQGSSATTVGLLATSEMARGLFHRLILMSGSPVSPVALDTNQKLTFAEIALRNSCPSFPTLQFVRCMQKRQVDSIVLADEQLTKGRHLGKLRSPMAVIQKEDDGRFLPPLIYKDPMAKITEGSFENVPIIIGVTSSEMSGFLSSLAGKPSNMLSATIFSSPVVLKQFIRAILSRSSFGLDADLVAQLATFEYFSGLNVTERQDQAKDLVEEMLADYLFYMPALSLAKIWSRFSPVHLYVFDYVPFGPESTGGGQDDDPNSFARSQAQRKRRQNGEKNGDDPSEDEVSPITQAIHGSDLKFLMEGQKGSAQDRDVANMMIDFWINFIHKGSPLQSGLDWPHYREETKEYLFISDEIQVRAGFRKRQEEFWTQLIKEVSERSCPRGGSSGRGKSSLGKSGGKGAVSTANDRDYYNEYESAGLSEPQFLSFFPVSKRNLILREETQQKNRKSSNAPLIFTDVSPVDISKRFYTFDSNLNNSDANGSSFYLIEK